jgi:hypothetical protein
LAALGTSIGIGIVAGIIGGFIASRSFFEPPKELFEDSEHWHDKEILEEYVAEIERQATSSIQRKATQDNSRSKDESQRLV